MAAPFQIGEFDIMFNEGISKTGAVIDLGSDLGVIEKKGAWYSYKGQRLGQGRDAVREELKLNPKLVEELEALIVIALKEKRPILRSPNEVNDEVLVEV